MNPSDIPALFDGLTTPHLADACLRKGVEVRCAPASLRPVDPASARLAGRVRPARHYGSVDIFLEALEGAAAGDVLVVDNGGREDEACVGDLIALEARAAGLTGMVIWGLHRDTVDLRRIGLPVFSRGVIATGPLRLDPREPEALVSARVGPWRVTESDVVIGDEDGVLFVPADRAAEIAQAARRIRETEHAQAAKVHAGVRLREQLAFSDYLAQREKHPEFTFRQHLRRTGGAVEE